MVVVIFGTTTVEGEAASGSALGTAAASCGPCAAAPSYGLDAVAWVGTDAVTTVSGTLNGTSARARTAPEFASTSSSLIR